MAFRVSFVLVTAFFLTMNVLLWRSEMRPDGEPGSEIPVEVVARRLLTSPDNSNLEIFRNGRRAGFARWSANIGENLATGRKMRASQVLEGEVQNLDSYTLDCDGEFHDMTLTNRTRFYLGAEFDTNMNWKTFAIRLIKRPATWEVRADAELETLTFTLSAGDGREPLEKELKFEEFKDPAKLLGDMGVPFAGQVLAGFKTRLEAQTGGLNVERAASRVRMQANNDHLQFHGARARVYRLSVRLFEDREIVAVVSRVGEILKVSLPFEITLINEELTR